MLNFPHIMVRLATDKLDMLVKRGMYAVAVVMQDAHGTRAIVYAHGKVTWEDKRKRKRVKS